MKKKKKKKKNQFSLGTESPDRLKIKWKTKLKNTQILYGETPWFDEVLLTLKSFKISSWIRPRWRFDRWSNEAVKFRFEQNRRFPKKNNTRFEPEVLRWKNEKVVLIIKFRIQINFFFKIFFSKNGWKFDEQSSNHFHLQMKNDWKSRISDRFLMVKCPIVLYTFILMNRKRPIFNDNAVQWPIALISLFVWRVVYQV